MIQSADKSCRATNPIEVATSLKGLEYPADKQGLIQCAKENEARDEVIKVIKDLPDKNYDSPIAISREISNVDHYGLYS